MTIIKKTISASLIILILYFIGFYASFYVYKIFLVYNCNEKECTKDYTIFIISVTTFIAYVINLRIFGPKISHIYEKVRKTSFNDFFMVLISLIIVTLYFSILFVTDIITGQHSYSNMHALLYFIACIIIMPTGEEMYFRFTLWNIIKNEKRFLFAPIGTFFIWLLPHFSGHAISVLSVIPLGIFLTFIRLRTDNIMLCILLHSWNNALVMLFTSNIFEP